MATLIAPETVAASTRAFPAQTGRPWERPRGARHHIGHHELTGQFRIDLRDQAPDLFEDVSAMDWSTLSWRDVGRRIAPRSGRVYGGRMSRSTSSRCPSSTAGVCSTPRFISSF